MPPAGTGLPPSSSLGLSARSAARSPRFCNVRSPKEVTPVTFFAFVAVGVYLYSFGRFAYRALVTL